MSLDNMLSGLESLGLGKMSNIDLYGNGPEPDEKRKEETQAKKIVPVVNESDFLFEKSYKCPICDSDYKAKVVKTGKARLLSQDVDLRPRYSDIDSLKYGVVVCPICGYATMAKTFGPLSSVQVKLVKEQIAVSFTGLGPEKDVYSYDDAITRHKLALVNSVVKRAKLSERAYTCMLIAWLLRGKGETLPENTANRTEVLKEIKKEEIEFLTKARDGFMEAFIKESFPLCGLDEHTSIYLIAALCEETGKPEESLKWASRLLSSTTASDRIKDRARRLKEIIKDNNA